MDSAPNVLLLSFYLLVFTISDPNLRPLDVRYWSSFHLLLLIHFLTNSVACRPMQKIEAGIRTALGIEPTLSATLTPSRKTPNLLSQLYLIFPSPLALRRPHTPFKCTHTRIRCLVYPWSFQHSHRIRKPGPVCPRSDLDLV